MKRALLFLLLCPCALLLNAQIVINEISQGPAGSQEYVELLVTGSGCGTCVDLRQWIIDSNNGHLNGSSTTGVGIGAGSCRFSNDAFWSCIPSGTLITFYNGADVNPSVPANDLTMADSNYNLVIPISSALFERHTTLPNSLDSIYPTTGWVSGGSWTNISMANTADGFQVYDPTNFTRPVFSLGYGSANTLGDIYMGAGSATDDVFYADNTVDCDFTNQANWLQGCAGDTAACGSDDGTPGAANNAANLACIQSLRVCPAPTLCIGDTALLVLSTYRGSIQWQQSPDSITWTNISGATSDTAQVIVDTTKWYRAEIIEGTCLPIYSPIKQFVAAACFDCGVDSIQDADGNWYQTVLIGSQCWTKTNMYTTSYPDSSSIIKGPPAQGANWSIDSAWYSCPPDAINGGEDCPDAYSLGNVYQWSAAMNGDTVEGAQGICPTGWHIATDAEWCTLENEVESGTDPACNLTGWRGVSTGSLLANHAVEQTWTPSSLTADPGFGSSGFDLVPSGYRHTNGLYNVRGSAIYGWTSTHDGTNAWDRYLGATFSQAYRISQDKARGHSVRCLRDCPTTAVPGPINGMNKLNTGQIGVNYAVGTVSGASSYTWTVPAGAIITSGQGTVNITVDFDTTFGYVCVTANNICGPSGVSCLPVSAFSCGIDSVQDADGNWYQTVQIGSRCWTNENMRTTKYPDSTAITKGDPVAGSPNWTVDLALYSCPPNAGNTAEDCAVAASLGMLYQWSAAMNGDTAEGAQGVCPTGWHVPTDAEWCTLENLIEAGTDPSCNITGWRGVSTGSKMADHVAGQSWTAGALTGGAGFGSSGLSVGPSGFRNTIGNFDYRGNSAYVWSSAESGSSAWNRLLTYTGAQVGRGTYNKAYGFSVRCVKDCPIPDVPDTINGSTNVNTGQTGVSYSISPVPGAASYTWTVPPGAIVASGQGTDSITVDFDSLSGNVCVTANNSCGTSSASCLSVTVFNCGIDSVQDADGNWYQTILFGSQCWTKSNMRTTKYPDSTAITKGPSAQGAAGWTTDLAQYSCPPNTSNNGEDCLAAASLGMLYQWSAAMDGSTTAGAQGVCPASWHVPTDAEWCTLENTIEAGTDVSCNLTGWRGTSTGSKMADHVTDQNWTAGTLTGDGGFGSSGFDLGPSGYRYLNGLYADRGSGTRIRTSTGSGSSAWRRVLYYTTTQVGRDNPNKAYGTPVRCLKD